MSENEIILREDLDFILFCELTNLNNDLHWDLETEMNKDLCDRLNTLLHFNLDHEMRTELNIELRNELQHLNV